MEFIYRLIYQPNINYVLRNTTKALGAILPNHLRIPPTGNLRIDLPNSKPIILSLNQTSYLGKELFWGGIMEFEYMPIFESLIKKVRCFYDVGANIGLYSLLAARFNPQIQVVAFEPAAGPLYFLRENVGLNSFRNIRVENMALADQVGTIEFFEIQNRKYPWLKHNLSGESNAGSKTQGRDFVPTKVEATTFDQYVKTHCVSNIDLIKIDTEGTEHLILKNASNVFTKLRPILISETLFQKNEVELEEVMKSFGYRFFNHLYGQGLEEITTLVRETDNGVRNCFFVPEERIDLITPFCISK